MISWRKNNEIEKCFKRKKNWFPASCSIDYTAKLVKGDYTIQLQLRHDSRKILDKFQDTVVHLRRKLPAALSFDVVTNYLAGLRGSDDKFKAKVLARTSFH